MVFSLLWVCESPKWGLELEYARLTDFILWLLALQSVPRLAGQLLSVEYNK